MTYVVIPVQTVHNIPHKPGENAVLTAVKITMAPCNSSWLQLAAAWRTA